MFYNELKEIIDCIDFNCLGCTSCPLVVPEVRQHGNAKLQSVFLTQENLPERPVSPENTQLFGGGLLVSHCRYSTFNGTVVL